ncbi:DUF1641 domain-containing protein [Paenibacillus humicola]|uniref:DUF1641 domain-containing protein n=1 Tax=Paenibacillus humicola TaxID=3110540 RepID=UPI00237AAEF3|nr:DUF1641 domain-containing protein [Paenibacillus humicola]
MTIVNSQESSVSQAEAAPDAKGKLDLLEQLTRPEIQDSLTVLIENLPKMAEMMTQLTKAYDFAQAIMTDRVLIDDLKGGFTEFAQPIQEKAKSLAQAAMEANERAQSSRATIGIFGLLNMLKDPQVQYALRFSQAFLDVTAEQKKRG